MWIEKHTGPPVLKIEQPQTVEEMKSRHSIIVFGCFNDAGIEKFEKVAEEFLDSDVKFLATNTEEVMKTYECELGTIMMLKDFDDPKLVYEGVNKKEVNFLGKSGYTCSIFSLHIGNWDHLGRLPI